MSRDHDNDNDRDREALKEDNKFHLMGVRREDVAVMRAVPGIDWPLFVQFVDKRRNEAPAIFTELAAAFRGVAAAPAPMPAPPQARPEAPPQAHRPQGPIKPQPQVQPQPRVLPGAGAEPQHHGKSHQPHPRRGKD